MAFRLSAVCAPPAVTVPSFLNSKALAICAILLYWVTVFDSVVCSALIAASFASHSSFGGKTASSWVSWSWRVTFSDSSFVRSSFVRPVPASSVSMAVIRVVTCACSSILPFIVSFSTASL
ncbi:hypothetical protein D3C86_1279760 [compost metagenome]